MEALLSPESLAAAQLDLPEWTHNAQRRTLSRTFVFQTFSVAIRFVDAIAEVATEIDHHPDIDIRYNKVRLEITTHSAGGLTRLDFVLATHAEEIADDIGLKAPVPA
jgi:4a-hydroxytetrahydrobiopterin dehydratase